MDGREEMGSKGGRQFVVLQGARLVRSGNLEIASLRQIRPRLMPVITAAPPESRGKR